MYNILDLNEKWVAIGACMHTYLVFFWTGLFCVEGTEGKASSRFWSVCVAKRFPVWTVIPGVRISQIIGHVQN